MFTRCLAASLLSVTAVLACSSESKPPGSLVASAGAGTGSSSGGNGGNGAAGAATSLGGRSAGGSGPVLNLDPDAGSVDPDAGGECSHLNIGILGNPGARASSNFQQWLVASGTSAQRIHTTRDEPLSEATLRPFDVVVLDWLTRDYTAAEAEIFAAWVSAGGGVVSMSGYSNNTVGDWHANSLLAPLGVAYSGSIMSDPIRNFATHPVTAGLTSVTFQGGYPVSDLGGGVGTRTPIAFFSDASKTTVGIAIERGKGRAVVWGDEWIEFDSEWSTLPEITQFWVQLFTWIAPVNKCELSPPK